MGTTSTGDSREDVRLCVGAGICPKFRPKILNKEIMGNEPHIGGIYIIHVDGLNNSFLLQN